MRRLPLILSAVALLVALAGPVAAKVVNVTNPMAVDLDGADHSIYGLTSIGVGATATHKIVLYTQNYPNASGGQMAVFGGRDTPTQPGGPRDPYQGAQANQPVGSVYVERVGQVGGDLLSGTAAVWVKTGPLASDWRRVALEP